jgi:hypothetical protein
MFPDRNNLKRMLASLDVAIGSVVNITRTKTTSAQH